MAWCLFGATLFARGYLQPTWSRWTCLRWSEATQKWGQRNFSKNVNYKRSFSTCFRLLNTCSPKGILNPLCTLVVTTPGWSVRYRGTVPHAATRCPLTSWPTLPGPWMTRGCSMAAQTVHTDRRPRSYCGPACPTLNPASEQSYCSFNSHTNLNSALMKYTLHVSGWTHIQRSYTLTLKFAFIAYWSNW